MGIIKVLKDLVCLLPAAPPHGVSVSEGLGRIARFYPSSLETLRVCAQTWRSTVERIRPQEAIQNGTQRYPGCVRNSRVAVKANFTSKSTLRKLSFILKPIKKIKGFHDVDFDMPLTMRTCILIYVKSTSH